MCVQCDVTRRDFTDAVVAAFQFHLESSMFCFLGWQKKNYMCNGEIILRGEKNDLSRFCLCGKKIDKTQW